MRRRRRGHIHPFFRIEPSHQRGKPPEQRYLHEHLEQRRTCEQCGVGCHLCVIADGGARQDAERHVEKQITRQHYDQTEHRQSDAPRQRPPSEQQRGRGHERAEQKIRELRQIAPYQHGEYHEGNAHDPIRPSIPQVQDVRLEPQIHQPRGNDDGQHHERTRGNAEDHRLHPPSPPSCAARSCFKITRARYTPSTWPASNVPS